VYDTTLSPLSAVHDLSGALVSATMTVNGITYSVGDAGGSVLRIESSDVDFLKFFNVAQARPTSSGFGFLNIIQKTTLGGFPDPPSLGTPFTYDVSAVGGEANGNFDVGGDSLNLNIELARYDVSTEVAAVPEPSTWAMLLLGFAGLGYIAHRRKS